MPAGQAGARQAVHSMRTEPFRAVARTAGTDPRRVASSSGRIVGQRLAVEGERHGAPVLDESPRRHRPRGRREARRPDGIAILGSRGGDRRGGGGTGEEWTRRQRFPGSSLSWRSTSSCLGLGSPGRRPHRAHPVELAERPDVSLVVPEGHDLVEAHDVAGVLDVVHRELDRGPAAAGRRGVDVRDHRARVDDHLARAP